MNPTASLAWVFIALAAAGAAVGVTYVAAITRALQALAADPTYRHHGPRGVHLRQVRRRAVAIAVLEILGMALGGVALVTPPPVRSEVTLLAGLTAGYLILVQVALLWLVLTEELTRRAVTRLLAIKEAPMPTPPPVTHWLHSRTLRVNALLILLFIFTQLPNMPHVPPDLLPWLTMAVGLLNMLLRLDTNSAIAGTPAAARSATTINIQSGGVQTGDGTAAGVVVGGDVDHLDNLPTPWVDAMTAARAKAQEPPDGA